jgi:hypothetical protein
MSSPDSLVVRAKSAAGRSLSFFAASSKKDDAASKKKKDDRDDDQFPRPPAVLSIFGLGRSGGFAPTPGLAFA